ncbi:hypothetical protein EYF80_064249 [Liparis tanakae]|uniref:Uncharacterized protein n=1 Tax=Liparis tanakae TaxID=230148 RepID=A0A4Z2EAN2_9TELE|nr:hypothetical protein EYF80_064249 [Liparis tanakae]
MSVKGRIEARALNGPAALLAPPPSPHTHSVHKNRGGAAPTGGVTRPAPTFSATSGRVSGTGSEEKHQKLLIPPKLFIVCGVKRRNTQRGSVSGETFTRSVGGKPSSRSRRAGQPEVGCRVFRRVEGKPDQNRRSRKAADVPVKRRRGSGLLETRRASGRDFVSRLPRYGR